ncbi:hypothetical protein BOTCAL_0340g00060 [Botryotinia calthae]|uniref:Tyrosinase C-terminal domain-containing protein n=1 Tax=Botryotinia calthae TaxID=38488 RepID=A0A4Y8CTL9_9HELO|nr:hypothetical protein BOTCAL_0340g00060 [Botryotinia calthae]
MYTEGSIPAASFSAMPPPVADGGNPPRLTCHNEFTLADAIKAVYISNIEAMVNYLKANLRWTVEKRDGTVVPMEQVSGLLVTLQDEIVIHPADETKLPGRS